MSGIFDIGMKLVRSLDAETAHKAGIKAARVGLVPKADRAKHDILRTELAGLDLPNPVGLAAGFDKNAEVPDAMLRAGFGFVECGTVTPRPQIGNPRPRLFRLTEDRAVINRMGFNNEGLDLYARRLKLRQNKPGIVGANLGANKDSDDRAGDYIRGLQRVWGLADYITINISSPNTPGLRDLQGERAMEDLLGRFSEARAELAGDEASPPVFLKVAPDLDPAAPQRIVQQARQYGINAIIVSNTTISRPKSLKSDQKDEVGGLSGAPLKTLADKMLSEFAMASEGRIPLIGVGGISSGADAYRKIRLGASAVQLYSALVYEGPMLAARICDDLAERLKADGFSSVSEAVGTA